MSRFRVVAVAAGVVSLAAPALASAKGDAKATIQSPTHCDAAPGTRITIRFLLTIRDADGTVRPFTASGVFVKLARVGHPSFTRPAQLTGRTTGRYTARVTMPRGGLRRIDVGLRGTVYEADGSSHPAPHMFPVTGDPCRAAR